MPRRHGGSTCGRGFLGTSDTPIALSLGVTFVIASLSVGWSVWLFATGRRLKP